MKATKRTPNFKQTIAGSQNIFNMWQVLYLVEPIVSYTIEVRNKKSRNSENRQSLSEI